MYSQTKNKVGIETKTPTEFLDINGTARVRELPLNGSLNAINTKPDGTLSNTKDQTFSAVKTIVVDKNGVIGTVDGLPITEAPNVKTIQYSRSSSRIDGSTPVNSITTLGNLSIRFNATTTGSNNSIEFMTAVGNNVTAFADVSGAGGNHYANWKTTVAAANTWYKATAQGVTPANRDTYTLMITLHNSEEIYRVSLICNAGIPANTNPIIGDLQPQVIIFIERLQLSRRYNLVIELNHKNPNCLVSNWDFNFNKFCIPGDKANR